jgi:predicted enzyme related to lactoylglutathione lyase
MIRGGAVVFDVHDVSNAVRFYIETLGMKLVLESAATATIDAGEGFLIELRQGAPPAAAPSVLLFPKVPIDEAIAIYENRGVTFTVDRTGDPIVARFADPDGNRLALVQAK